MKKKIDPVLIITTVICLLPIILSILLYNKLPTQIAIHFDNNGNPDNYWPKDIAIFGPPVFLAIINVYTHFRLNNDPKRCNTSFLLVAISKWVISLTSVIVMPRTLFIALGYPVPITIISNAIVGVIFVAMGNYLPKCKQNYTLGIKNPWTLDNTDIWNKTHHMAGYLWIIGGLIMIISSFTNVITVVLTVGVVFCLVTIPFVYSYLLYSKSQQ